MLKLWGRINSINVQKVLWALDELKVPYERIDAGLQFGVVNEAFLPQDESERPRAHDRGRRVRSVGIQCRRALSRGEARRGHALAERSSPARRRRPLDGLGDEHRRAGDHPGFLGLIRTPAEKRDLKAIEEGVEKLAQAFQVLEQSLEGRDHVAGKSFTMGDIPLGTFVYRWNALAVKRPKLPRVEAYYQRLQQRASYKKHVMLPLS